MLRVPDLSAPCPEYPPAEPAISYSFPLDPFQQWAVAAIHRDENVLATAKTGSGKTLIAEYAIAYQLAQGRRVFYTTPIKSLSNQKYHDLKHLFPAASVGILTGDIKSNPDAQIVIMTTEILRNLLFKTATATAALGIAGAVSLEGVGAVVFDEVHYINDPDRGHVWEECLILAPPTIRLIMLSATIDQPAAFATWIGEMKGVPCNLLATTYRIVPLVHSLWNTGLRESLVLKDSDESPVRIEMYREWLRGLSGQALAADKWKAAVGAAKKAGESAAGRKDKVKPVSFTHRLNECIATMREKDLLPALFFTFSRRNCEQYAEKVSGSLLDSTETANVKHILAFHLHRYADTLQKLPQYHQLVGLLERGIAFHHSGLLPLLKEGVELLFQRGYIRVLFCTESLAIGVNLPARSVVFTDLEKPTGASMGGFRSLRYDEYAQMAGRAGRRGKDVRGFVFYLPAKEPLSAEELRGVMSGALPALQSRIQFHYDFVLKAMHLASSATATAAEPLWSRLLGKSYWQQQRTVALRKLSEEVEAARLVRDAQRGRLTIEQWATFDERADLQHKVRYLTNSKQKTARLALRHWEEEHDGAVWRNAEKIWNTEAELNRHYESLKAELAAAESVGVEDRVQPVLVALKEWGLVEGDGLTHRGILATECNEANPLLMTELYTSAILRDATQEEIVGTLAALITDGTPTGISAADYDFAHADAAKLLEAAASRGARIDLARNIASPEGFWTVSAYWSSILTDWMAIEDSALAAGTIVKKYEIYEANLMRAVLKCANLVDEWLAMATFCGDVAMLDRMRGIHERLLRGIAQPESLYLRL